MELKSVHSKCNLFAFSLISAEYLQKIEFLISQGSVATRLKRVEWSRMNFVSHFVRFPAVHKVWKSINIWQSYREFKGGNFFMRHSVVLKTTPPPISQLVQVNSVLQKESSWQRKFAGLYDLLFKRTANIHKAISELLYFAQLCLFLLVFLSYLTTGIIV